jgi:hypothetical protein
MHDQKITKYSQFSVPELWNETTWDEFLYLKVEFSTFREDWILVLMHPLFTKSHGIEIGVVNFLNNSSSYTPLLNPPGYTYISRIYVSLDDAVSNPGKIIQSLVNDKVDDSSLQWR